MRPTFSSKYSISEENSLRCSLSRPKRRSRAHIIAAARKAKHRTGQDSTALFRISRGKSAKPEADSYAFIANTVQRYFKSVIIKRMQSLQLFPPRFIKAFKTQQPLPARHLKLS